MPKKERSTIAILLEINVFSRTRTLEIPTYAIHIIFFYGFNASTCKFSTDFRTSSDKHTKSP